VWKSKCPQRQTFLSLGPTVLAPMVASPEKTPVHSRWVQLRTPLPHRPASTGHPIRFSKVTLREGAEPNSRKRIYTEMSETEPGEVAAIRLPSPSAQSSRRGPSVLEGQPFHGEGRCRHHLHAAEPGMGQGAGEEGDSFSTLLLIRRSTSVHPRHTWELFLPVANAEGNASMLPQARMGHFTCAHRYRASPKSQIFHSNTGQRVHLFHVAGRVFPN